MPEDFLEAVDAVGILNLTKVGTGSLVLHASLDQVDGINSCGSGGAGNRTQSKSIHGFQDLDNDSSILGALN